MAFASQSSCFLTDEYFVMVGKESCLYPPDVVKSGTDCVPQQKLADLRAWLDEFDISYRVSYLKQCIYRQKSFDDILVSLPENDRSCRAKLGCSVETDIIEHCIAGCEKHPSIQTVRKWIRAGDWKNKMEKYIQRNAKDNRN